MEKVINILKEKIKQVEVNAEEYYDFEETRQSLDYDGAKNYFGHGDDCYDIGVDRGEAVGIYEFCLSLINILEDNN